MSNYSSEDEEMKENVASDEESNEKEKSKIVPTGMEKLDSVAPKDDKTNLMWIEKYRPESLSEIISHEHIIQTIQKLVSENKMPHLMFYGPPGTGKTTAIIAIAKQLYGKNYQKFVMELNASDERGIDVVREQIKNFASSRNIFSTQFKLIILDEADQLTKDAQNALRRIVEKYTKNARFCFICNYINKIIPALQSRCMRFRFPPLKKQQVIDRLKEILKKEGVEAPNDQIEKALEAVFKLSGGDMRKCLNILQSTRMSMGEITEESVYRCTGHPLKSEVHLIVTKMLNSGFEKAYDEISKLKTSKGLALQDIITAVTDYVFRLQFDEEIKIYLLEQLAEIEYRASFGTSEKIQLSSLIAAFQFARQSAGSKKPIFELVSTPSF